MTMPHLMDSIHLSVVQDNSSEREADLAGYGVVLLSCSKGYVEKVEGRSQFTVRQAVLKMKKENEGDFYDSCSIHFWTVCGHCYHLLADCSCLDYLHCKCPTKNVIPAVEQDQVFFLPSAEYTWSWQ